MSSDSHENAREIESAIAELESDYGSGFFQSFDRAFSGDQADYDSFWARQREIRQLFKEYRLWRQDREELWERLNKLCDDVRELHESQKDQRRMLLDSNRDTIAQALSNLAWIHNFNWMNDMLYGPDLKDFWADAKEVSELFRETKPLRKDDREELWDEFQGLCDRARDIQEEKNEAWRERMEEHIDRWRALIDKNEEVIERLRGQIEHCEDIRADARTDDFADEVQGWIDEKERKIDDIEATNSELWRKISEVEAKLR